MYEWDIRVSEGQRVVTYYFRAADDTPCRYERAFPGSTASATELIAGVKRRLEKMGFEAAPWSAL